MNYWDKRTTQNRDKAIKLAKSYSAREKKLFQDAYRKILNALNAVMVQGTEGLTRTELWQLKEYMELRSIIEKECTGLAQEQLHLVDAAIEDAFETTIGRTMKDFESDGFVSFLQTTERMREQVLNTNWSGENYSSRVWNNRNALATKLQGAMEDMIILGKSPNEVKRRLADEMGVGWRVADRLMRTESAHIFTAASLATYKDYGVKQVKWLGKTSGNCDVCAERNGMIFELGTEPTLPAHPNCTCCYSPVIILSPRENSDKNTLGEHITNEG